MDEIQNNNNEKTEEASSPQELPEPPIPEPELKFVESPLPLKTTEKKRGRYSTNYPYHNQSSRKSHQP